MAESNDSIQSQLEVSRKELLDLGLRNRLLNYRLLKTRGLEVVDERPSELLRILVEEGRTMSFLPGQNDDGTDLLSQPAEEETDVIAARHTDSKLQTELSSSELQSRLLSTYRLANTFIQEQGVNTLFLALGVATWYESESSELPRHAPLLLIPVELARTSVRERFRLQYRRTT